MSLKKRRASIRCAVFAVGAVLASFTTFGGERTALRGNQVWSDPKAWDPEGEPESGDKIGVPTSAAGSSLTLNKDVTISIPTFNLLLSSASGTGRFVGTGYTFAPAESAEAVTYPFAVASYVFRLTGESTRAPYAMTDADISFSHDAAAGFKAVDFSAGTFNFYDADGSATDRSVSLFGDTSAACVAFGPQVSFKMPNLSLVSGSSTTDSAGDVALVINGAKVTVADKFAYAPNVAVPHRIDVVITNKADVSVGSLEAVSTVTSGGDAANPVWCGLTVNDAKLTATGAVTVSSMSPYIGVDVSLDNATLVSEYTVANAAGMTFGFKGNSYAGNRMVARDSQLICSNSQIQIGYARPDLMSTGKRKGDYSFDVATIEAKGLSLCGGLSSLGFTNSFVNLLGGKLSFYLDNADLSHTAYFKDTVITNGTLGGSGCSRLVFDGGSEYFTGYATGAVNLDLVLTNGADFVLANNGPYFDPPSANAAVCTQCLNVVDGTFTCRSPDGGTCFFNIGFNANHPNNRALLRVGKGGAGESRLSANRVSWKRPCSGGRRRGRLQRLCPNRRHDGYGGRPRILVADGQRRYVFMSFTGCRKRQA